MTESSLFDPHVHMTSRTTDDYEAMARAGIRAVLEPASWNGQPRTNAGSFADYFAALVGWERARASQFGIRHYCALGIDPKEANDEGLAHDVLEMLPRFLVKEGVLAVGEIGLEEQTSAEEDAFARQLQLAARAKLPVIVHTPERDKKHATERTLAILREHRFPSAMTLVEHVTEETIAEVLASGSHAGCSKLDPERVVALVKRWGTERIVVGSAADWGVSDPLAVPKTADALRRAGGIEDVDAIVWRTPIAFYARSGRFDMATRLGTTAAAIASAIHPNRASTAASTTATPR